MKYTLASIFAVTTVVAVVLAFRQFLPVVLVAICVAAASVTCAAGLYFWCKLAAALIFEVPDDSKVRRSATRV